MDWIISENALFLSNDIIFMIMPDNNEKKNKPFVSGVGNANKC